MNFAGLLFLIAAHFITGRGILQLFRLQQSTLITVCFSFIISVPVLSLMPSILQLMHIPITIRTVAIAICICAIICCIPIFAWYKKPVFSMPRLPKPYEWPAMLIIICLSCLSVWRAYYMPPYSRDMLSGPEMIAEFTVREHTMINSCFTVDLTTTNNYHKSPFVTCLQVIYKLLVFPFGQIWLSLLFVPFITWVYSLLLERLHPLLAGFFMILFFAIPEMFAYTFVLLYDYSNMVFFFSGFFFLMQYLLKDRINYLAFSIFLLGMATYIRTESLILISMMIPLLVYNLYKKETPIPKIALRTVAFFIVPVLAYFMCIHLFVRNFVPIRIDVAKEINPHLADLSVLFNRYADILSKLIYSYAGTEYYGYFFFIFTFILLIDAIFIRKYSKEGALALYGVAMVYLGLGFIGYLLPLADLGNTTKRGFFKAIPIVLIYMSNSGIIQRLSNAIKNWEDGTPTRQREPKPVAAKTATPQPTATQQRIGKKGKK